MSYISALAQLKFIVIAGDFLHASVILQLFPDKIYTGSGMVQRSVLIVEQMGSLLKSLFAWAKGKVLDLRRTGKSNEWAVILT